MLSGLNHITLAVRDANESFQFYTEVLLMRPVARWPKGAYLLVGETWIALHQDENTRTGALPEYTHVAFSVSPEDFDAIQSRIRNAGAAIWQENWTEGASLYFLDPNGHKLEIHASDLDARIRSAKASPWDGLEFFV